MKTYVHSKTHTGIVTAALFVNSQARKTTKILFSRGMVQSYDSSRAWNTSQQKKKKRKELLILSNLDGAQVNYAE